MTTINPYVYIENKNNVDKIKYIIKEFNDYKRAFGFCFHNKQQNACNLFLKHYKKYDKNKTTIKPYLLIGDDFNDERLKKINLDYDYRNINDYEKDTNKIGYVVAQYNMGYDFKKIDYICICDKKISYKDIIQCIGRGVRSDELGENGCNKAKYLYLIKHIMRTNKTPS